MASKSLRKHILKFTALEKKIVIFIFITNWILCSPLKISYLLNELHIHYKLSFKPLQFRNKLLSCIFLIDYIITQQSIHGVELFLSESIIVFSVKLSNSMKTNLCVKNFKRHWKLYSMADIHSGSKFIEFPYFVEFREIYRAVGKANASKQRYNSLVSNT